MQRFFIPLAERPPPPPDDILPVLMLVRSWVDPRAVAQSEGLSRWQIPMTPSVIESAHCLNQLRQLLHPEVPHIFTKYWRENSDISCMAALLNHTFCLAFRLPLFCAWTAVLLSLNSNGQFVPYISWNPVCRGGVLLLILRLDMASGQLYAQSSLTQGKDPTLLIE